MKWSTVNVIVAFLVYGWFVLTVMTSVIEKHGELTVAIIGVLVGPVFLGSFFTHPEIKGFFEDKDTED